MEENPNSEAQESRKVNLLSCSGKVSLEEHESLNTKGKFAMW